MKSSLKEKICNSTILTSRLMKHFGFWGAASMAVSAAAFSGLGLMQDISVHAREQAAAEAVSRTAPASVKESVPLRDKIRASAQTRPAHRDIHAVNDINDMDYVTTLNRTADFGLTVKSVSTDSPEVVFNLNETDPADRGYAVSVKQNDSVYIPAAQCEEKAAPTKENDRYLYDWYGSAKSCGLLMGQLLMLCVISSIIQSHTQWLKKTHDPKNKMFYSMIPAMAATAVTAASALTMVGSAAAWGLHRGVAIQEIRKIQGTEAQLNEAKGTLSEVRYQNKLNDQVKAFRKAHIIEREEQAAAMASKSNDLMVYASLAMLAGAFGPVGYRKGRCAALKFIRKDRRDAVLRQRAQDDYWRD